MHAKLIPVLLGLLIPFYSFSQVQKLLDPNEDTNTIGSGIKALTTYKGDLYGYANANDKEGLYKLNPATEEMELLVPNLFISNMVATDSLLILIARIPGLETDRIWKSDGTVAGTEKIANSPEGFYYFQELQVYEHFAYIPINPNGGPTQLWSSDGSESNTHPLGAIPVSGGIGYSRKLAFASSKAFFVGNKNQSEVAIYETDGTPTGTQEKYSNPSWDRFSDSPWNLLGVDSLVYFIQDELNDKQLWQMRRDTSLQISSIPNVVNRNSGYMYQIHSFNGAHYFHAGRLNSQLDSLRLLRTNGTIGNLDTAFTFKHRGNPLAFFSVSQGLISIVQGEFNIPELSLYTSSGMSDSVITLNRFQSLGQIGVTIDSIALFDFNSITVMRSDGTPAGTYSIPNFSWTQGYTRLVDADSLDGSLYLSGRIFETGEELFRLKNGNLDLFDDVDETPKNANIRSLNALPTGIVFSAFSDSISQELWYSDGTPGNSGLLRDIYFDDPPNTGFVNGSFPASFTAGDDILYFSARDTNGSYFVPFVTDGSAAGTNRLVDLWTAGPQTDFNLSNHFFWKGKLYLGAAAPTDATVINVEPYQYDPVLDSALLLKEVETTLLGTLSYGSYPQEFAASDSFLFFLAETFDLGQELWRTDGSESGTQLVKDIEVGTIGGFTNPVRGFSYASLGLDSLLIFTAHDRSSGWQLWRSNGYESGTYVLQDSLTARALGRMIRIGEKVLFWENRPGPGLILWSTNGSNSGTEILLDSLPFARNVFPENLFADEQIAFFSFLSDSIGLELWKTDGTAAGTGLVKDMVPGLGSSNPSDLISIGGNQYLFWADDSTGDRVLWVTDGTESGTNILPGYKQAGEDLFRENQLLLANGFVYFVAEDVQSGEALFRYDLQSTGIREIDRQERFMLYPNPAQNELSIRSIDQQPQRFKQISILDLQGREVVKFSDHPGAQSEIKIHLPERLPPAYYILRLESADRVEFIKFFKR